jgi:hypothetical protein
MRRFSIPFLLPVFMGVLLLALVACQTNNPESAPTPTPAPDGGEPPVVATTINPLEITPSNDAGMVVGRVVSISTTLPLSQTPVYLAEVFRDPNGSEEGAFVFNSAASPGAITDGEGNFVHMNVKPAEYVIFVGDPHFEYQVIQNPDTQKAQLYFVEAGRVTQVGELRVPLAK